MEKENIFFCGEEVTEKEKGGNNWTRKIHFFAEREGKGGKYLEKENIFEIKYISYFFAKEDILHICHICHL